MDRDRLGNTAAKGLILVTVTADAAALLPGVYDARLCLNSNDPDEPGVVVPVSFTVN